MLVVRAITRWFDQFHASVVVLFVYMPRKHGNDIFFVINKDWLVLFRASSSHLSEEWDRSVGWLTGSHWLLPRMKIS
jgi:hypothetical protein